MDLEQFEADARAAFATGKYRLVCHQFGSGHDNCCLLLMVLLHRERRPSPHQTHCDQACHLYGGDHRSWVSMIHGFDGVGPSSGSAHPAAHALGDRLARDFKVRRTQ